MSSTEIGNIILDGSLHTNTEFERSIPTNLNVDIEMMTSVTTESVAAKDEPVLMLTTTTDPTTTEDVHEATAVCVSQDESNNALNKTLLPHGSVSTCISQIIGSTMHHMAHVMRPAPSFTMPTTSKAHLPCFMPLPRTPPVTTAFTLSTGSISSTLAAPTDTQQSLAGCCPNREGNSYAELPPHNIGDNKITTQLVQPQELPTILKQS